MEARRDVPAPAASPFPWRALWWAALVLGVALRAYPLAVPYPQPEQEVPTGAAMQMIARGDWQPVSLFHGTGFVYALRLLYTATYAAGRLAGRFGDRLDLLASFLRDPFPYVFAGRLLVLVASIAGLLVASRAAAAIGGAAAGAAAMAVLAVTFTHVRESHYVWYDVPASTLVAATALAGMVAVARGRTRDVVLTAILGGVALATKHSMFAVAAPVLATALLAGSLGLRARALRVLGAGAAALAAYAVCCPYTFLDFRTFLYSAWFTAAATEGLAGSRALPFGSLWTTVVGPAITLAAIAGLVAALRHDWRRGVVLAAFPLCYAAVLAGQGRLHARYLVGAAPLVAALAGIGVAAVGRLAPGWLAAPATLVLLALVTAGSARQSLAYDRFLARPDTRVLAAEWIAAHVPAGARIWLPSVTGHPNPLLPLDETMVRLAWRPFADALVTRGAVDRSHPLARAYLSGVFGDYFPAWQPKAGWVVLSEHPVVAPRFDPPPAYVDRLRAAGAHVAAEFRGFEPPLERVVYDPIDANYVPLDGFARVLRPGPNVTIWEVPAG